MYVQDPQQVDMEKGYVTLQRLRYTGQSIPISNMNSVTSF